MESQTRKRRSGAGKCEGRGRVCGKGRGLSGAEPRTPHQNGGGGKDMLNLRGLKSGSLPGQTAWPTEVGRRLLTCLGPHHPNQPSGTSVLAGKRELQSQTQSFLPQPCDIFSTGVRFWGTVPSSAVRWGRKVWAGPPGEDEWGVPAQAPALLSGGVTCGGWDSRLAGSRRR